MWNYFNGLSLGMKCLWNGTFSLMLNIFSDAKCSTIWQNCQYLYPVQWLIFFCFILASDCKDKKNTKKCKRLKKKGKCSKKNVWKKCKKTCGKCWKLIWTRYFICISCHLVYTKKYQNRRLVFIQRALFLSKQNCKRWWWLSSVRFNYKLDYRPCDLL